MRALSVFALLLTLGTCLVLLGTAALAWTPLALSCITTLTVFSVATFFLIALIQTQSKSEGADVHPHRRTLRRSGLACLALFATTFVLVSLHVPVRLAFAVWRADFDRAAERFTSDDPWDLVGERIGPYRVRDIAQDERGGLYICVREEGALLTSYYYGFARDATGHGPPFAAEGYDPVDLGEGWSWFAVYID